MHALPAHSARTPKRPRDPRALLLFFFEPKQTRGASALPSWHGVPMFSTDRASDSSHSTLEIRHHGGLVVVVQSTMFFTDGSTSPSFSAADASLQCARQRWCPTLTCAERLVSITNVSRETFVLLIRTKREEPGGSSLFVRISQNAIQRPLPCSRGSRRSPPSRRGSSWRKP